MNDQVMADKKLIKKITALRQRIKELEQSETNLRQAAAVLQENEERYRLIAENSADVIAVTDMNLRFTFVSPSVLRMRGFTSAEAVEQTLDQIMTSESYKRVLYAFEEEIKMETSGNADPDRIRIMELEEYKKDGSTVLLEVSLSFLRNKDQAPVGILSVARDITDRKRAENALKAGEAMLKSMFQAIPVAIAVVDSDRIIRKVNDFNFLTFGYKPEEVIGRDPRFLYFSDEDYRQAASALHATSASMTEVRMRRKDGTAIWALVNRSLLHIENEPTGEVVTALDITARKALEEQLRQSQKMEAVGQLAGGVAHDFNNILQAIMGYTQMVIFSLAANDKNREKLLEAYKAGRRASELVQQLLAFSRRQVLKMEPVDLNQVVADLVKMLSRLIGENIELAIVPKNDLWIVNADRGQIEQVLMNLWLNARDAMPEGGRLSIETDNIHIDEEFYTARENLAPGRYVRLTVIDTGVGMDSQTREKIFEPFFTTKGLDKGTGLGLATVYGIIQQHEGVIDVKSELGKGSSFSIYLPVIETAYSEEVLREPEEPVTGGYETVLLAEDDGPSRNLLSQLLTHRGYRVLEASDGEEALRLYSEHANDINILLLDVVMPRKNGRIVYEEIIKTDPDIKCLFLSGYSIDSIQSNFIAERGLCLIKKPFNNDELLRILRRELDQ